MAFGVLVGRFRRLFRVWLLEGDGRCGSMALQRRGGVVWTGFEAGRSLVVIVLTRVACCVDERCAIDIGNVGCVKCNKMCLSTHMNMRFGFLCEVLDLGVCWGCGEGCNFFVCVDIVRFII